MLPFMILLLLPNFISGERTLADERPSDFYNHIFRIDDFLQPPDVICHPGTECTGVDYLMKVLVQLPDEQNQDRLSEAAQGLAGELEGLVDQGEDLGWEILEPIGDFIQDNAGSVQENIMGGLGGVDADPFQALSHILSAQEGSKGKGLPLEEMIDRLDFEEEGSKVAETVQKLKDFVNGRREDSGDGILPPEDRVNKEEGGLKVPDAFEKLNDFVNSRRQDSGDGLLPPEDRVDKEEVGIKVSDAFQKLNDFVNSRREDSGLLPPEDGADKEEEGIKVSDAFEKLNDFVNGRREDSGDGLSPPEESDNPEGFGSSLPSQEGVDNTLGDDLSPANNFDSDLSRPEGSDNNPEWFSTHSFDTLPQEIVDSILPQEQPNGEKAVGVDDGGSSTEETALNDSARDEALTRRNDERPNSLEGTAVNKDDGLVVNEDKVDENTDKNDFPGNIAQLMDEATIFDFELFAKVYGKFALECTSSTANSSKFEDVPLGIFRAIDLAYIDFLSKFT